MKKSVAGMQTFSFGQDLVFDAFIQFKVTVLPKRKCMLVRTKWHWIYICKFQEYIGFVKCMNAMKGMKLCYKDRDSEKAWTSNIRVSWNELYEVGCSIQVQGRMNRHHVLKRIFSKGFVLFFWM